jgi:hypothetical protein
MAEKIGFKMETKEEKKKKKVVERKIKKEIKKVPGEVKKIKIDNWRCFHPSENVRNHNVGNSDYSKHKIQPWDIWIEYRLNPFDADIVKRILRKKAEGGMNEQEARKLDYQKIIHICQERIRQIEEGIDL